MMRTHSPLLSTLALALASLAAACESGGPVDPGTLRFGQIGSMQLTVVAPLALGLGETEQVLTWTSSGFWTVREEVRYRGLVGDVTERELEGSPDPLANAYAQWITDVNDNPGLSLFIDELDPDLDPDCLVTQSRITLALHDDTKDETRSWTRCVPGFLQDLGFNAGPDPAAPRVANLARLARDYTVGGNFRSAHEATQPFGTLDKGEDTPSGLTAPVIIQTAQQFESFWALHAPGTALPPVDFEAETVIVAARGERREAGDSLAVRAVRPTGSRGAVITLVERVPGDFCSPAELTHVPFHVVVTPRLAEPVSIQTPVLVELVNCG
ncbi:MAG: hypothetical protein RLN75_07040 [Longimicrobiales bacterium]